MKFETSPVIGLIEIDGARHPLERGGESPSPPASGHRRRLPRLVRADAAAEPISDGRSGGFATRRGVATPARAVSAPSLAVYCPADLDRLASDLKRRLRTVRRRLALADVPSGPRWA